MTQERRKWTYQINPRVLKAKGKEFCTTEELYQWYLDFMEKDPRWRRVTGPLRDTILNENRDKTLVRTKTPALDSYAHKENFSVHTAGEYWVPHYLIIKCKPEEDSGLTETTERLLGKLEPLVREPNFPRLWFLKKGGPGICGGYDVRPLMLMPDEDLRDLVGKTVKTMNEDKRFRRDTFVLQEGIQHPMLTEKGQKFDLRLYVLIVGASNGRMAFYTCRVGLMRNSLHPYEPESTELKVQLTNTSQNKHYSEDYSQFASRFTSKYPWHKEVYGKFKDIVKSFSEIYGPIIHKGMKADKDRPFAAVLGFDAVIEAETMNPVIIEINAAPQIASPWDNKRPDHPSMVFMKDVYELGIVAILSGKVGMKPPEKSTMDLVTVFDSRHR